MSVIGLRVGPFEIVDEAQVPEAGRWYHGRRTDMTRKQPRSVLVKLLGPDASSDERAGLQKQYDVLRGLEDPRVPSPVGVFEGTGALAVAAVHGTPLSELVAARRAGQVQMTPATLLDVALELAETLQHAHHRGRHHGHLSPENVLLGPDGHLWVWGYGPGPTAAPPPAWLPPERARGDQVSGATDQWSLAAVIASLVTGNAPWRGGPDAATPTLRAAANDPTLAARRGDPGPIVGAVETQWPALGRLLRRMLDGRPQNRFPSLHPVRQELLALSRKAGGVSGRRELGAALWRDRPLPEAHPEEDAAELDSAVPAAPPAPEAPPMRILLPATVETDEEEGEAGLAIDEKLAAAASRMLVGDEYTAESDDADEGPPSAFWLDAERLPTEQMTRAPAGVTARAGDEDATVLFDSGSVGLEEDETASFYAGTSIGGLDDDAPGGPIVAFVELDGEDEAASTEVMVEYEEEATSIFQSESRSLDEALLRAAVAAAEPDHEATVLFQGADVRLALGDDESTTPDMPSAHEIAGVLDEGPPTFGVPTSAADPDDPMDAPGRAPKPRAFVRPHGPGSVDLGLSSNTVVPFTDSGGDTVYEEALLAPDEESSPVHRFDLGAMGPDPLAARGGAVGLGDFADLPEELPRKEDGALLKLAPWLVLGAVALMALGLLYKLIAG